MFDLISDTYESYVKEALGVVLRRKALCASLLLGRERPEHHRRHNSKREQNSESDTPTDKKVPFSSSHSHELQKCHTIENAFQARAVELFAYDEFTTDASDAQRQSILAHASSKAKQIAAADQLAPHEKLLAVGDALRQILTVEQGGIAWEAVVEFLSIQLALLRLTAGDECTDVLLCELDLAISYCGLQRFAAALDHVNVAMKVLDVVCTASTAIPASVVQSKLQLIACVCELEPNPDRALYHAQNARRLAGERATFAHHLCVLVAASCCSSSGSFDVADALASCTASAKLLQDFVVAYVAICLPHLDLVAEVDGALRGEDVAHSRRQLLHQVMQAGTKRELEEVSNTIDTVARSLKAKIESLQLALLRQVEFLRSAIGEMVPSLESFPTTAQGLSNLSTVVFFVHRVMACGNALRIGQPSVCEVIDRYLSPEFSKLLCMDVAASSVGDDIARIPVRGVNVRRVAAVREMAAPSVSASEEHRDPLLQHLRALVARPPSSSQDADGDDHDAAATDDINMQWIAAAERVVGRMYATVDYRSDASKVNFLTLMQKWYRKLGQTGAEIRCAALVSAAFARLEGPQHEITKTCVAAFHELQRGVHAPTISPAWGVQPLLGQVTLHCETPGALIFFTLGSKSLPLAGEGTLLHATQYTGPIILDRQGRVTLRAFAMKDGRRSGVVEARFSVLQK